MFSLIGKLIGTGAKAVGAGAKTLMEGGSFLITSPISCNLKLKNYHPKRMIYIKPTGLH